MIPSTKIHARSNQRPAADGRFTSYTVVPTRRRITVSSRPVNRTRQILPRKYAVGGIGVPRSRRSTFSSRSTAIEMPSAWKLVDMMPAAIIAGT